MGPYERYVGGYRIYHFSVLALSAMSNVAMSDDMEWTVVLDSMLWKARHMNDEIERGPDHPIAIVAWASLASDLSAHRNDHARARAG